MHTMSTNISNATTVILIPDTIAITYDALIIVLLIIIDKNKFLDAKTINKLLRMSKKNVTSTYFIMFTFAFAYTNLLRFV